MPPIVGTPCQLVLGSEDDALAAVVCYVHGPDEVTVAYFHESGHPDKHQFCPWIEPGHPEPQGIFVRPLPEEGGASVSPAGSQAAGRQQQQEGGTQGGERGGEQQREGSGGQQGRAPRGPQQRKMEDRGGRK